MNAERKREAVRETLGVMARDLTERLDAEGQGIMIPYLTDKFAGEVMANLRVGLITEKQAIKYLKTVPADWKANYLYRFLSLAD